MRPVVPIANLQRRLPEGGRIRIGEKTATRNGKEAPTKIDTFRFTSPDRESLEQVAVIYGGTVTEWKEPKADPGQFQLRTEATELHIVLPPDPLGGSPIYESWSGGGCDRRCDGISCEVTVKGPDGPERADRPCLCVAAGAMTCKPKTRLSVILPDVRFTGVWRLDTGSWNAAQELPGMVDLIQSQQTQGLSYGILRLEWRRSVVAGQTNVYAVPVLGVPLSIEALAAGATRLGAIGPAVATPELTEGGERTATDGQALSVEPPPPPSDLDDEVCEAEVVEVVTPDSKPMSPANKARFVDACEDSGVNPLTVIARLGDPHFVQVDDLRTGMNQALREAREAVIADMELLDIDEVDWVLAECEEHGLAPSMVVEVATDGRTNDPAELTKGELPEIAMARQIVQRRLSQPAVR